MKTPAQRHIAWEVLLNGKQIDIVFYTSDCDAEYVKKSLVDHDGYNPTIVVRKWRGR